MKHLEHFDSKESALNKVVSTPYVAEIDEQEEVVYGPEILGEFVTLVKDSSDVVVCAIPEPADDGYVDLGLPSGKKWASCNLGATSPCESGNFYAWGEINTNKTDYSGQNYIYGTNPSSLTKYNESDGKTILDNTDDVVYVMTDGEAHMPSKEDAEELINNTTSSWCACTVLGNEHTAHTVVGRLFVSKTDSTKKIFIPAVGYQEGPNILNVNSIIYIWTTTLTSDSWIANSFYANNKYSYVGGSDRTLGFSIRGVKD